MRRYLTFAVVLGIWLSGCGALEEVDGDGGLVDGSFEPNGLISFTSPDDGDLFYRETLDSEGRLVAPTTFTVSADSSVVSVQYRVFGGAVLGEGVGDNFVFDANLDRDSAYAVEAVGYDGNGSEITKDLVAFTVLPANRSCHEVLDLYKLDWSVAGAREGVPDPVSVNMPIAGIRYRYDITGDLRTSLEMDCLLARSLAEAAPYLKARDVVEIVDIGVYNYRCIGGGEPPGCTLSQHALARALDIHELVTSDGTAYRVEEDWVVDPENEPTCSAQTENAKDAFLHDFICEMYDRRVWSILLTPNFNVDHSNHFHVDLTVGGDLMRSARATTIDSGGHAH